MNVLDTLESGRAYIIDKVPPVSELAQLWAKPGDGYTYWSSYHVTHVRGARTETYVVESEVPGILASRRKIQDLTGIEKPGWHYGKLARVAVEWLGIRQPPLADPQGFLPRWHYQHCIPCEGFDGTMYDMSAAYWQVAARCPSPVVEINRARGSVRFCRVPAQVEDRWNIMLRELRSDKRLRLTIIGVSAVGWNRPDKRSEVRCLYRGEKVSRLFTPGALQAVATLTVRSSYELTQIQTIEAGSLYSNADCVILEGDQEPDYWKDAGIEYSIRARGCLDVSAIGAWKCGDRQTRMYDRVTGAHPFQALNIPDPVYHRALFH